MYVRVIVEIPRKLNQKQKDILKEFDESTGSKAYEKNSGFWSKVKDAFGK